MEGPKNKNWMEEVKAKKEKRIKGIKQDFREIARNEAYNYLSDEQQLTPEVIRELEPEVLFQMSQSGLLTDEVIDSASKLSANERFLVKILNKFGDETLTIQAEAESEAPYYAVTYEDCDLDEKEAKLLDLHYQKIKEIEKKYSAEFEEQSRFYRFHPDYLKKMSLEELAKKTLNNELDINQIFTEERFLKEALPKLFEYGDKKEDYNLTPHKVFTGFLQEAAQKRISVRAYKEFYQDVYPKSANLHLAD